MERTLILIPALNPPDMLISYVKELKRNHFNDILIVNDGSSKKFDFIFDELGNLGCDIYKHDINLGKGNALKNGFKYFLNNYNTKEFNGIVTVDSDGQHLVKDVLHISKILNRDSRNIILGCRNFDSDLVLLKSKFGNKVTINVFKLFYRKEIRDTQTGLRGFPVTLLNEMIEISGNKFEYETRMLIYCFENGISLKEVEIETVYFNNNVETHFNPVKDSLSIYGVIFSSFLKCLMFALFSFIVDIILFIFFLSISKKYFDTTNSIFLSTIGARIISSLFNFYLNKFYVFKSKEKVKLSIIKYYILCLFIMISSALFTSLIWNITRVSATVIKVFVDILLFFISYVLQNNWVFKRR